MPTDPFAHLHLDPGPRKRSVVRRLLPALILLLALSAGTGAVAEGQGVAAAPATPVAPVEADASLADVAEAESPSGYDLQEVSVSQAPGAVEVVTADYLGPGVRNAITYTRFGSANAAGKYLRGQASDTCSVRTTATCLERVGEVVVSATSSSTCPHPTHDVLVRAEELLLFGTTRAQS